MTGVILAIMPLRKRYLFNLHSYIAALEYGRQMLDESTAIHVCGVGCKTCNVF